MSKDISSNTKEDFSRETIKNTNEYYGAKNQTNNNTDFKRGDNIYTEKELNKEENISNFSASLNDYRHNNDYNKQGKKFFKEKNNKDNHYSSYNKKGFHNKNYQNNSNRKNMPQKFDDSNFELKKPVFINSKINKNEENKKEIDIDPLTKSDNTRENFEKNENKSSECVFQGTPINPNTFLKKNSNYSINASESITITNDVKKPKSNEDETQNKTTKDIHIQDLLTKQPEEINTEIINSKKTEMENCLRGLSNMNLNFKNNQNINSSLPNNISINPNFSYMMPNNVSNINNINNLHNIQINNLPPMKNNFNNIVLPYSIPTNTYPNTGMNTNNQFNSYQAPYKNPYMTFPPHLQNFNPMYGAPHQYFPQTYLMQGQGLNITNGCEINAQNNIGQGIPLKENSTINGDQGQTMIRQNSEIGIFYI
jgi:hypothetical protein